MIQAKYIFTIEIDEEGKRTINCELPPHDLDTDKGLYSLLSEIAQVHNYCLDMLNDSKRMLLELANKQGNVTNAEALNNSNSPLIQ